jgi:CheY-like chemotaxis protein
VESVQKESLNILLVEDDEANQKVVQIMLERLGHVPDLVTNGLEALEIIESQHYDIILIDITMPEVDSIEMTKIIRGHWPPDVQPYIIAISSLDLAYSLKFCISTGIDDCLCKPFSKEELQIAICKSEIMHEQSNSSECLDPQPTQ